MRRGRERLEIQAGAHDDGNFRKEEMAKTIRSANNSLPCSGHGSLLANGVCACHHGYLDTHCNIDSCQVLTTCSGHSTCEAGLCRCDVGWQPPSCTIDTCPGHFPAGAALGCHALQGHGQCVQGVCVCAAGFKGDACEEDTRGGREVDQRRTRTFCAVRAETAACFDGGEKRTAEPLRSLAAAVITVTLSGPRLLSARLSFRRSTFCGSAHTHNSVA